MWSCGPWTAAVHLPLIVPGDAVQCGGQWRWRSPMTCWLCMPIDGGPGWVAEQPWHVAGPASPGTSWLHVSVPWACSHRGMLKQSALELALSWMSSSRWGLCTVTEKGLSHLKIPCLTLQHSLWGPTGVCGSHLQTGWRVAGCWWLEKDRCSSLFFPPRNGRRRGWAALSPWCCFCLLWCIPCYARLAFAFSYKAQL